MPIFRIALAMPLTNMFNALSQHHLMEDLASIKPNEPEEYESYVYLQSKLQLTSRPSQAIGDFVRAIHRFFESPD